MNDHYDGKKSDGLEKGGKKSETKIDDHYDVKKGEQAPKAEGSSKAAPAELSGT